MIDDTCGMTYLKKLTVVMTVIMVMTEISLGAPTTLIDIKNRIEIIQ